MAMPALGGVAGGVKGAGPVVAGGMVVKGVMVAAGQSNDVVGGKVVQPHSGSMLVWTGYELGEVPHTHQPGPSAMAVQVFWGSEAWVHNAAVVATAPV